jgi:hypothetical protein
MSTFKRLAIESQEERKRREEIDRKANSLRPDAEKLIEPMSTVAKDRPITKKELFNVIKEKLATGRFFPGKKVTLNMYSPFRISAIMHYIYSGQVPFAGAEFYFTDSEEVLITIVNYDSGVD